MPAGLADITVAVLNKAGLDQNEVQKAIRAFQKQVSDHFYPAWRIRAKVGSGRPNRGDWWLLLLENADHADSLGFHDLTDQGCPLAKVFVETAEQQRVPWTVAASHELLEMLADPDINLMAAIHPPTPGEAEKIVEGISPERFSRESIFYAREVCDPCAGDWYKMDGTEVYVSNFVYPSWFESFGFHQDQQRNRIQFDQQDQIRRPFELRPGGYALVFDHARWELKKNAVDQSKLEARTDHHSRRVKRMTSRQHWTLEPRRSRSVVKL